MVMQRNPPKRNISVTDVTGSRRVTIEAGEDEASIGEMLDGITARMGSPTTDSGGRPIMWTLRNNRTGERLHRSQSVAELEDGDEVTLQPNIDAG